MTSKTKAFKLHNAQQLWTGNLTRGYRHGCWCFYRISACCVFTGVINPAGDAGDTSQIFWLGDVNWNIFPHFLGPQFTKICHFEIPKQEKFLGPPHRTYFSTSSPPNLELALTSLGHCVAWLFFESGGVVPFVRPKH